MNLILSSDFPSTVSPAIVSHMHAASDTPRIAWIPPTTEGSGAHFAVALERFAALGFRGLEYVDIDEDRDEVQLAYLHEFDIIYLSGGDPLRFRYNAIRSGLAGRLRQCVAANRLVVAASGGALLLTPNVSLFRLQHEAAAPVLAERGRFEALGAVAYELVPHINRWDTSMVERVRRYSEGVDNDVVCLADGSAIFAADAQAFTSVGQIIRYRKGNIIES